MRRHATRMREGLSLILRAGFMARRPELDWDEGPTGMQPLSRSRYGCGWEAAVVMVRLGTRNLWRCGLVDWRTLQQRSFLT